jgi:hypothetical protein
MKIFEIRRAVLKKRERETERERIGLRGSSFSFSKKKGCENTPRYQSELLMRKLYCREQTSLFFKLINITAKARDSSALEENLFFKGDTTGEAAKKIRRCACSYAYQNNRG